MRHEYESPLELLESRSMLSADLICSIGSPGAGASVSPGVQYSGNVTITNQGTSLSPSSQVGVQIYYSTASSFNASTALPLQGATALFAGGLLAGSSNTDSFVFSLPASVAAGTYYLFAWVDRDQAVPDSNRANNISTGVSVTAGSGGGGGGGTTGLVDLRTTVELLTPTFVINQPVRLKVSLINDGPDAIAAPGTYAQLYRTRGTMASPSTDEPVGDLISAYTMDAHEVKQQEFTFTFSEAESTGTWRFYAVADGGRETAETNETNNNSTLVRGLFNLGVRDLAGSTTSTTLPGTFVRGQKISGTPSVKFTYRNASDYAFGSGTSMSTRAFLRPISSPDGSADIAVSDAKTESISKMAAGASKNSELKLKIPTTLAVGSYKLIVQIDDKKKIAELDETNNTLEFPGFITVQAPTYDPAIVSGTSNFTGPIKAGKSASASLVLNNLGNSTYSGQITVRFSFFNSDGVEVAAPGAVITKKVDIKTDKTLKLDRLTIKPPLLAGTYTVNVSIILPDSVTQLTPGNDVIDLGQVTVTSAR